MGNFDMPDLVVVFILDEKNQYQLHGKVVAIAMEFCVICLNFNMVMKVIKANYCQIFHEILFIFDRYNMLSVAKLNYTFIFVMFSTFY